MLMANYVSYYFKSGCPHEGWEGGNMGGEEMTQLEKKVLSVLNEKVMLYLQVLLQVKYFRSGYSL